MSASAQTLALLRGLSVRRTAVAAATAAALVFVGGVASGSGRTMSFDADLGVPTVFVGLLLLLSAGLLWLAPSSRTPAPAAGRTWRAMAVLLALVGLDAATSLHARVGESVGSDLAAAAPLLALLAAAVLLALLLPENPERSGLLAALAALLGSTTLVAAGHGGGTAAALLALFGAAVLPVVSLAAVQRCHGESGGPIPPPEVSLRDLLLRVDALRVGAALALALAALLGVAVLYHSGTVGFQTFDLRSQQGLNTFASMALLFAAGALALLRGGLGGDPWHAWTLLGIAFLAMACVDMVSLHHEIGQVTGIHGQFVLFPVVVAAAVGWFSSIRLSGGRIRALLIAGALLWGASQAIDVTKPEGYFHWWVVPEESLELAGSTLFATALLLAVQATAAGRGRGPASRDEAGRPPAAAISSGGG